jgi:protein-tyrosine phosphatase
MPNILIICTANICRSPVVEVLLRNRLQELGLTDWNVSSAGTWAEYGSRPSEFSAQLMAEQGFDISNHRSRIINEALLAESDLVLCMELGHVEALRAEFRKYGSKIYLLSEMSGRRINVKDPYGGPREEYERMVSEVTDLIDKGLPRAIRAAQANEYIRLARE